MRLAFRNIEVGTRGPFAIARPSFGCRLGKRKPQKQKIHLHTMAEYLIALLNTLPSLPDPRNIPPGGKTANYLPYLKEITGGKNKAISYSER